MKIELASKNIEDYLLKGVGNTIIEVKRLAMCKTDSNAVLIEVRAIVTRKFVKKIDLDNSVTGNEKRLAVIIECELIDDLPERIIGKTIKICEHFS